MQVVTRGEAKESSSMLAEAEELKKRISTLSWDISIIRDKKLKEIRERQLGSCVRMLEDLLKRHPSLSI